MRNANRSRRPIVPNRVSSINRGRKNALLSAAAVGALAGFSSLSSVAQANTYTWNVATGSLNVGTNWLGNTMPGANDIGVFSVAADLPTGVGTGGYTVGELQFTTVSAWTITDTTTLTLDGVSGVGIDMSAASNSGTISAPVALAGNQTWNIASGKTLLLNSATGLAQGTNNNLTLNGPGTVQFSFTSAAPAATGTGTITVNNGTALFKSGAVTQTNMVSASDVLALGGGSVNMTSSANTGQLNQTFASTTVNAGQSTFFTNRGSSSGQVVNLQTITRNIGGTVFFSESNSTTSGYKVNTSVNGIVGGWATDATDFMKFTNSTTVIGNSNYVPTYTANTWGTTNNTDVTQSATTVPGSSTTNSLLLFQAANDTVTLSGTNTITSGGILNTSGVTAAFTNLITGGNLQGPVNGDLIFNMYSAGNLQVNSAIVNNTSTALTLSGTGAGSLILGGANTFTGGLYLNAGTLALTTGGTLNGNAVNFDNNSSAHINLNGVSTSVGAINTTALLGSSIIQNANASAATLTINTAGTGAYAGTIQDGIGGGALAITMTGSGTQTLSGALSYSGLTTASSGTLKLNSTPSANTPGYRVDGTLDVSALTSSTLNLVGKGLSGSGSVTGSVSTSGAVAPGAGAFAQGNAGSLSLTGNLTLNAGASVLFGLSNTNAGTAGGSNNSYVNVVGGVLNLPTGANSVTLDLYQPGTTTKFVPTAGATDVYDLFAITSLGTGTFSGASNAFTLGGTNPAGFTHSFAIANGYLQLTLTPSGVTGVWTDANTATDNNWSDSNNWTAAGVPHVAGDSATFDAGNLLPGGNSNQAVNLDEAVSLGNLAFNQGGWTISTAASQVLTLDNAGGGAAIASTGNNAISTAIALNDSTTITEAAAGTLTLSGNISNTTGAEPITINGAGTTVLAGTNSYGPAAGAIASNVLTPSIGTTLSGGGTLQVGSNSALAAGDLAVTGSSTLQNAASGNIALPNNISISNGAVLTLDNNGGTLTLGGPSAIIADNGGTGSGTGAIAAKGSGTVILQGSNTYGGGTTLSGGDLQELTATSLGAQTGTATFNGGTLQLGATITTTSRNYVINISQTAFFDTNTYNLTNTGTISSLGSTTGTSADGLTKIGVGNLTLSGADTFTGQTVINGGTLTVGTALALQNSTLNYAGQGGALSFGTVTSATLGGLVGTQDLALTNIASTPAAVALTVGGNNATTIYTGNLGGLGSVTKTGTGTLTVGSGTGVGSGGLSMTTGGAITVNEGTLVIGGTDTANLGANAISVPSGSGLPAAAQLIVQDNATITTTGTLTIDTGSATGGITGATLTLGGTAHVTAASFSVGNGTGVFITGPNQITIGGNAVLTLNGAATGTYTFLNGNGTTSAESSTTTLNGGMLALKSFVLGVGGNHTATLTLNSGIIQALAGDPTPGSVFFLPASTALTANVGTGGAIFDPNSFSITIAQPLLHTGTTDGGLTVAATAGAGTAIFSGADTFNGGAKILAGTAMAGVSNATTVSGAFGPSADGITLGNTTGSLPASLQLGSGAFTVSNAVSVAANSNNPALSLGGSSNNNGTFSGAITLNNNLSVVSQATSANTVALTGGITGGVGIPTTLTFAGPGNINVGTLAIADAAGGTGTVSVSVTGGTTTLTGSNTYTGMTTIGGSGTLQLGDGNVGHDGTIASQSVVDNGSLIFNRRSTSTTYGGTISGTGTVTSLGVGGGTQTLSGSNTYSGGTAVNGGTLIAGITDGGGTYGAFGPSADPVTLGSAVVGLNANLFTGGAFTVANPITVQAQAAGFLFLGGNTASSSAFSGPITVNNSNLYVSQVSGGTVSFTGGITAGSAATTLNFQGPGNMSVSGGSIADNAGSPSNTVAVSLTAGTLTLSSASTYSGGTTVSAGTLYVNNTTGSGTGSGAVNINGGTLAGSGKISGAVNLLSNTNLIPGSVAAPYATLSTGTLSLANNAGFTVTLNSDTTNSNSVLSVTGVASFGAGNGALLSVTDVGTGTLATLNTVYTVVTSNAAVQGAFANLSPTNTIVASNGLVYGVAFNDSFAPAGGGDVTLTLDAVPEPASLGLLGIGGLAMMRRRRRAVKPIASARA